MSKFQIFLISLILWSFFGDLLCYLIRAKTEWDSDRSKFKGNGISFGAGELFGVDLKIYGDRHDFRYRNFHFNTFPKSILMRFFADIELGFGVFFEGLHHLFNGTGKLTKRFLETIVIGLYGLFLFVGTRLFSMFHYHQRKGDSSKVRKLLSVRLEEKPL